ncbi:MAG: hypothetical protein ACOYO1_00675 [Bacteroidales bacterium]
MKKIIILIFIFVNALTINAQSTIIISNNDSTENFNFIIKPINEPLKGSYNINLNIKFFYNQSTEIVTAIITNSMPSRYNFIWMPEKSEFTDYNLKSSFKEKYQKKLSFSRSFKRQIKGGWKGKFDSNTYSGCNYVGLINNGIKFENDFLKNEMFNLNGINLYLYFKVIDKAEYLTINFSNLIPFEKKTKRKMQLQYIGESKNFQIRILRNPCLEESQTKDFINIQIVNLKKSLNNLEIAKNKKDCKEIEEIKKLTDDDYLQQNIKNKYENSLCPSLVSLVQEYLKTYDNIKIFSCPKIEPCDQEEVIKSKNELNLNIENLNKFNSEKKEIKSTEEYNLRMSAWKDIEDEYTNINTKVKDLPVCNELLALIQKQNDDLIKSKPEIFLPPPPPLCKLRVNDIKKAANDINNLTDYFLVNKKELNQDKFDKITKSIDSEFNTAACKTNKEIKKAYTEYLNFVKTYLVTTKCNNKYLEYVLSYLKNNK